MDFKQVQHVMTKLHHYLIALLAGMLLLSGNQIFAGSLVASVSDVEGNLLEDAVVTATLIGENVEVSSSSEQSIDQVDKEFIPYVSVFQVGTKVTFPNHDKIRHHVYSFSPPKTFEIPLYSGIPRDPILFDQPGVVSLGCNIHDWMTAYAYIVETPHFGITDAQGRITLDALPPGQYEVEAWHPRQQESPEQTTTQITINDDDTSSVDFQFATKQLWQAFRPPTGGMSSYRQ